MKKILLAVGLSLSLTGCAAFGALQSASAQICDHKESARVALAVALHNAALIHDDGVREATIRGIQASLDALDRCPEL